MPSWVCGSSGGMKAVKKTLMGMWFFRGYEGSEKHPHGYVVVQGV